MVTDDWHSQRGDTNGPADRHITSLSHLRCFKSRDETIKSMIRDATECERAKQELRELQGRLENLDSPNAIVSKGFTKAGIRKLIARIHEKLALIEASEEARGTKS